MSRLKSYTQTERFYRFRRIATFVAVLSILVAALVGLNFRNLVLQINSYSNLILSILTLLLVITTAFYAWITYRMLVEMMESRRAEIRPILWVDLENPKFNHEDVSTSGKELTMRCFLNKIKISNYGRGTAINTRIKLSIPYEDGKDTTPANYIASNPIASAPTNFTPGSFHESIVRIYTPLYDLNKYKEEFLELRIWFEDIERNLYSMVQFYNLLHFPLPHEKENYYWNLKSEDIYLLPFSHRKSIRDDDTRVAIFGEGEHELIFRRRQPWKS